MMHVTIITFLVRSLIISLVECKLTINDIFIVVKTTQHYQYTRLPIIFETWFKTASKQTWFVTDIDNPKHQEITNGHMHVTDCPATHGREALCCKTAAEFNLFFKKNKKWFCHFDDDNFVNVHNLHKMLMKYSHKSEWYFGRYPLSFQTKLFDRPFVRVKPYLAPKQLMSIIKLKFDHPWSTTATFEFVYATLGAGCCISRALALRIEPDGSGNNIRNTSDFVKLPDDVTLGFIIQARYKVPLKEIKLFHSHYDNLRALSAEEIKRAISVSYYGDNIVNVPGLTKTLDPTRFYSLYCLLMQDDKKTCLEETEKLLKKKKETEVATSPSVWWEVFG